MPLIKWRDSFSVGVPQFDEDHQKLLEIINQMFTIVRDHKEVNHLSALVDKLIHYTIDHFAAEEKAMEQVGYPGLDEHKKIHGQLLDDAIAFKKRIDAGDEGSIVSFYHFLRDWLLTHIVEEDIKYAPFLTDVEDIAAAV
jgi:hemerythrin